MWVYEEYITPGNNSPHRSVWPSSSSSSGGACPTLPYRSTTDAFVLAFSCVFFSLKFWYRTSAADGAACPSIEQPCRRGVMAHQVLSDQLR